MDLQTTLWIRMDAQLIPALLFLRCSQPVIYLLPPITKGRQDRIRIMLEFCYLGILDEFSVSLFLS